MKRRILLIAMRRRGTTLMRRYMRLVDHLGDGIPQIAEKFYPRLISYRKRAMRIARRLHAINHPKHHLAT